jgi:hypothetical protein
MPSIPGLMRLAGALGVPVERLAVRVEDPAEEEATALPERTRRPRKGKTP